jgi:hypothetical protein
MTGVRRETGGRGREQDRQRQRNEGQGEEVAMHGFNFLAAKVIGGWHTAEPVSRQSDELKGSRFREYIAPKTLRA